jgi:hypothetical protein
MERVAIDWVVLGTDRSVVIRTDSGARFGLNGKQPDVIEPFGAAGDSKKGTCNCRPAEPVR